MIQRDYDQTNFITGMRAVAILLVFIVHTGGAGLGGLGPSAQFFVSIGRYGVQLFFVISGFTIFYQLFENRYTVRSFWLIRLARISIPYFPLIILIYLYLRFGGKSFCGWADLFNGGHVTKENVLAHLTYLSSYILQYQNSIIGVEWTLGVEVFFYILFGIIVALRLLKPNLEYFVLWFAFFFLVNLLLPLVQKKYSLNSVYMEWLPFSYGYMFLLGGFAYYLRKIWVNRAGGEVLQKRVSDLVLWMIVMALICALIFVNYSKIRVGTIEFCFAIFTFFVLVFFNQRGSLSNVFLNRSMLFLGSISYSFYLIHFLVIQNSTLIKNAQFKFAFDLIVTLGLSVMWYLIFEKLAYSKAKSIIKRMV